METIWRPKRYSLLSKELMTEKLRRDTEYEQAVRQLYAGTLPNTPQREQAEAQKKVLWTAYQEWAKTSGLYEGVTLERQLVEHEEVVDVEIARINEIKDALGQSRIKITSVLEVS
ncbi:MAG: hypothetical protein NWE89_17425 [Candidatus Bathyarchaeota archaeon]|nr:hypothetical protein [Candidatus Bathyarchaeota archaeon]